MLRSILLMSRPPLLCEEGNVLSHELVKLKLSHYPGSEILAFAFEAVNFASPIINSVLEIINSAPDMVICGRNKMTYINEPLFLNAPRLDPD